MEAHPHICFKRNWKETNQITCDLGYCLAIIESIAHTPIHPEIRTQMKNVALIKGAQATTAIEGNTLTEEEITGMQAGHDLPPSRKYQQIEVQNILDAMNGILGDILAGRGDVLITPLLIRNFHKAVGKNLGEHFNAIPGQWRECPVTVGGYRPPEHSRVPELMDNLCHWLREEFRYAPGNMPDIAAATVQAIVAHSYIAAIHPFSDGNGRTARLLEFFIMTRAGVPDIASHLLSNYYNLTRSEYYRRLDEVREKNDLTPFISYAVAGLREQLCGNLVVRLQEQQVQSTWRNMAYDTFDAIKKAKGNAAVNNRRRDLLMLFPPGTVVPSRRFPEFAAVLKNEHGTLSERTLLRDIEVLVEMELLKREADGYAANVGRLLPFTPSWQKVLRDTNRCAPAPGSAPA